MKLHDTEAITFDDLEEIWLLDDGEVEWEPIEIVLPDDEREDKHYVEL